MSSSHLFFIRKKTNIMKNIILTIALSFAMLSLSSQDQIMQENFGSGTWDGNPADYPDYTSTAIFGGDDSHLFQNANSTGYTEASGSAAVLMGSWSAVENTTFVMQCNTLGYTNVQLSFGIKHNSGGWGVCQLTNNYTLIEYSTDSTNWTVIDKANLKNGSSWPCADDNVWAYVELAEVLPTNAKLNIRFTHTNPNTHPFYLDDITLTGYPPDFTDPSVPGNPTAENIDMSSFTLVWNASTDNVLVSHYEVYKDGSYLLTTNDTIVNVNYQTPGISSDYTIVAYDVSGNSSAPSVAVPVTLNSKPVDYEYSWQKQQANILPGGNIEWKPNDFVFETGTSVRYIDFEGGSDSNDGLTKSTPWKHHPWDNKASGNAAACTGIHTYVFKRGVVYRGKLVAQESGTPINPIRLTSDPSWGTGKAYFFGSQRFTGGWVKANETIAPNIPNPDKVWFQVADLPETKTVCEIDGDEIKRLHLARSPNFQHTPKDPLETWWEWTGKAEDAGSLWLTDNTNLVQNDTGFYKNATVFSQEDVIVMCTVWKQDLTEWEPDNNRVKVGNTNFGGVGSKYYIENTPFLLDTTNEFYYDQANSLLFLRLEGDKDPNTTIVEAAEETQLIEIENKHDIVISGLTFGLTTAHYVHFGEEGVQSTIKMTGINNNITIDNNEFYLVNGGVSLTNTGSAANNSHSITVSDNNFQYMGDHAIVFATNSAYIDDINILRNNVYYSGYRPQGRWYGSIPAIFGQLTYGEVAGNVVDISWGNALDMFWGKGGGSDAYIPFIRGLIHQNKASTTLVGTNDYGGIESWQGGPTYCFNNHSHHASGYKHYNNSSIGYAYYFDGAFKHIVFNNIASGISHNRNSAGIMQVLGFYNIYAHNSCYNTNVFINAWKGTLGLNGHNTYLANAAEDVDAFFRHELVPADIPFEAYGYNVAGGNPFKAGLENRNDNLTLSQFKTSLESYQSQLTQTGWDASGEVFINPQAHDFRPLATSAAVDSGTTFFTAYPLAKVVGEWNFYEHPADPSVIMGDNFYMTEDFNDRTTYKNVPKNHLNAYNVVDTSFVKGMLEDWTNGGLVFDGSVYCDIKHSEASLNKSNNVDMETDNFIIEAFLRTEKGHTNGVIASKYNGNEGYELDIDASGMARLSLFTGGSTAASRSSSVAINDSNWHHVLAEVNRKGTINMFVDGELSNGSLAGAMPGESLPLTNTTDLLVGKDVDDNYFLGTMDFLRISKGNLYEARTTIDELYTWATDGPFLYDLTGSAPVGRRNAGAIEATIGECALSISSNNLNFGQQPETIGVEVTAENGFIIDEQTGSFFNTDISGDSIYITVSQNQYAGTRNGSITVAGCNSYQNVTISQEGYSCIFSCDVDTLHLSAGEQMVKVPVNTTSNISITSDLSFGTATNINNDTIAIDLTANTSGAVRMGTVDLEHCAGTHIITIVQDFNVGIEGKVKPEGLFIYPNPLTGSQLNVVLPANSGHFNYTITSLSGRVLKQGKLLKDRNTIQVHETPGLYILTITGNNITWQERVSIMD
jgi:hypothetical protein